MKKRTFKVALAGNPNCGKTTIFNILAGARQHVGNYSGVTVERIVGRCRFDDLQVELIDLPGIYSLSSATAEERVAFRELLEEDIDLVLNVIDAGNPQRNLYLTSQLAELQIPMLLVFNMIDDARDRGFQFNIPILEHYFGAPIVETAGASGEGIPELKRMLVNLLESDRKRPPMTMDYGEIANQAILEITEALEKLDLPYYKRIPRRCIAIRLLEEDEDICAIPQLGSLKPLLEKWRRQILSRHSANSVTFMADCRYGMISGACREAVSIRDVPRRQFSEDIDKIVTNRYLGLPIFFAMMFLVFFLTFTCSAPLMELLEYLFDALASGITGIWPDGRLLYLRDLLTKGIIGGVGGVLIFLPNILLLFLAIAFLEGTGYMARAAFVMDGFMHRFGLHGKSFIPMLLGFGCTVPAIMATRTIESERDRLTTIMILPLMSCGARLPIYSLLIPAFFPLAFQAVIMWLIYFIGVALALAAALLLKSTLFKGDEEIFVMELPPYRMPTFRSLLLYMLERSTMYLKKAGTFILTASILLYLFNTLPEKQVFSKDYKAEEAVLQKHQTEQQEKIQELKTMAEKELSVLKKQSTGIRGEEQRAALELRLKDLRKAEKMSEEQKEKHLRELRSGIEKEKLEYSFAGRVGHAMSYVFYPLGFDWKVCSALIGAVAGKELFVSQMSILNAENSPVSLQNKLKTEYTPLQGFCIMLFCLISMPCVATMAVARREMNSWKLMILQIIGLTMLAYVVTLLVYQIGSLF